MVGAGKISNLRDVINRYLVTKLRRLGFDNSKSDSNKLGWWFYDNSDFKVEIGLQLKDNVKIQLELTNFRFKYVDGFWSIFY